MNEDKLKNIVEAALLAAGRPMTLDNLLDLFADDLDKPDRKQIRAALDNLREDWASRAVELNEVSSGYRFQVKRDLAHWMHRLWIERPSRYSRALLETLAIIAYRQPVTRGEIEEIRGVGVSASIVKTLSEREWIKVIGHREVPGRPAIYGTTKNFLDHFGLQSLESLPPLAEIRDLERIHPDLFGGVKAAETTTDALPEGSSEPVVELASGDLSSAVIERDDLQTQSTDAQNTPSAEVEQTLEDNTEKVLGSGSTLASVPEPEVPPGGFH